MSRIDGAKIKVFVMEHTDRWIALMGQSVQKDNSAVAQWIANNKNCFKEGGSDSAWLKETVKSIERLDVQRLKVQCAPLSAVQMQKAMEVIIGTLLQVRERFSDARQFQIHYGWLVEQVPLPSTPLSAHEEHAQADKPSWREYLEQKSVKVFDFLLGSMHGYWCFKNKNIGHQNALLHHQQYHQQALLLVVRRLVSTQSDPQWIQKVIIPWVDELIDHRMMSKKQLLEMLDALMGLQGSRKGIQKFYSGMASETGQKKLLIFLSSMNLAFHYVGKDGASKWMSDLMELGVKVPLLSGALIGTDPLSNEQYEQLQKQLWGYQSDLKLGMFEYADQAVQAKGSQHRWSTWAHEEWAGWFSKGARQWACLLDSCQGYIEYLDEHRRFDAYMLTSELREILDLPNMGNGPGCTRVLLEKLNGTQSRTSTRDYLQSNDSYGVGLVLALCAAGNLSLSQQFMELMPAMGNNAREQVEQSCSWRNAHPNDPYQAADVPWLIVFALSMSKCSGWAHKLLPSDGSLPQLPNGTALHYIIHWFKKGVGNKRAERLRQVVQAHKQWWLIKNRKGQSFCNLMLQESQGIVSESWAMRYEKERANIEALVMSTKLTEQSQNIPRRERVLSRRL